MSALSGNASISVDADATGNITLGFASNIGGNPGALNLLSNLDVIHNGSGQLTFNRAVTGSSTGITKTGSGTLAFTGGTVANTYSGLTTVSAGGLNLGKTAGTDAIAGNVLVNGTGTLTLGAANQMKDTSNVEVVAGTFALVTFAETVNNVKLSGGAITNTSSAGILTSTTAYDFQSGSVSAVLAGTAGANKTTAGTVTLGGASANTYSGLTTVSAGGLTLNKTAAVDAIVGNLLINGTGAVTLSASNQINNAANVEVAAGNFALDANSETVNGVKLTGGAITGTTGVLTSTTAYDFQSGSASAILAGTLGATKTGGGTVTLSGLNTFTGTLNINEGTVLASAASATGQDVNSATNIILGGGTLQIRTNSTSKSYSAAPISVTSASSLNWENTSTTNYVLNIDGSGNFALTGNLTARNISTTTANNNQFNINRAITGTGDLIVETYNNVTSSTPNFSFGRIALGGDNTGWSGDLVIRQGTAQLSGDTALGQFNAGTGDIILGETGNAFGTGFLLVASTSGTKTIANNIIVRSGGFRSIRGNSDNSYNINGDITLEGDLNVHNGLFFTDKSMILNGDISGVGGLSITESLNPNFTRLTGNNTYSGDTTIGTGAVLNILSASGNAIGNSSSVSFAGAGSTLVFNSTNETIGSLASSGTDGAINLGANTLTTGGNNTSTSYGGTITGTGGGLTKTGTGTMTLTGANTHTGDTAVTAGKLVVTNSIGNSAVTVSGTGTILATDAAASFGSTLAIQNGAILAPGDAATAGTPTVTGTSTFHNGSIFSWDIDDAGTGYDKLVTSDVLGEATAGDAVFRIVASDALVSQNFWNTTRTWDDIFTTDGISAIADWATVFGDTVSVVNSSFTPIATTVYGSFSVSGSTLTWTAVPEPTSTLAGLLLGAGLLRRRRQGNGRSVVS